MRCYGQPCDVYEERYPYINDSKKLRSRMYMIYSNSQEESDPPEENNYPYTRQVRRLKTWCPHHTNQLFTDHRSSSMIYEIPTNYCPHIDCRDIVTETKIKCSSSSQTCEEKCISTTTLSQSTSQQKDLLMDSNSCYLRENKSCNTLADYDDEKEQFCRHHSNCKARDSAELIYSENHCKQRRQRRPHSIREYKKRIIDNSEKCMHSSEPDDADDVYRTSDVCSINSDETADSKGENHCIVDDMINFISGLLKPSVFVSANNSMKLKKKCHCVAFSPDLYEIYSRENHKADTKIPWSGSNKHRNTDPRKSRRHRNAQNRPPVMCQLCTFLLFFVGMYFFNSFVT